MMFDYEFVMSRGWSGSLSPQSSHKALFHRVFPSPHECVFASPHCEHDYPAASQNWVFLLGT